MGNHLHDIYFVLSNCHFYNFPNDFCLNNLIYQNDHNAIKRQRCQIRQSMPFVDSMRNTHKHVFLFTLNYL